MPRLASQKIVFRTGLHCAIQPMGQLGFYEDMFPVAGGCYLLVVQKGEDAPPEPPLSSVGLASECCTACAAGFTKYLWQRICRSANLLVHLPTLPLRACFSWEFSQQDLGLCWVHNPFESSKQVFSCLLLYSSSSQLWSTQEVYLWRYQSAETRNILSALGMPSIPKPRCVAETAVLHYLHCCWLRDLCLEMLSFLTGSHFR